VLIALQAKSMNWGIAMFGFVAAIAVVNYIVRGRHVYSGPVTQIRKEY
jgi:choline transport protein